jgi:hypothetical protein
MKGVPYSVLHYRILVRMWFSYPWGIQHLEEALQFPSHRNKTTWNVVTQCITPRSFNVMQGQLVLLFLVKIIMVKTFLQEAEVFVRHEMT